ncbi:hypothetical protein GCM10007301_33560 [Azorhizobium oxalatiphilum]|uniref:LysR substrate-binding domain-containing protein n=1 Tax=Azorhizobium oxalatiphilum TaxID=980631 RepID=A0A917C5E7_9HYPH|nr:hypothetical protein GCM10007301_33560 [Azorhizobium oxalatiphilum]
MWLPRASISQSATITRAKSETLQARKIVSQRKIVCAAPSYLDQHGAPKAVSELSEFDALVYWQKNQPYPWTYKEPDGRLSEAPLSWRLQFDNHEAIRDAAVRGMGFACLPSWLVREELASQRLVPVLQDVVWPLFDTYVVWPAAEAVPMKLRVAIDALVDGLRWVAEI